MRASHPIALVLLSGGQDSTTCLYWAKREFRDVVALSFDYGQSHVEELACAARIAHDARALHLVANVAHLLTAKSSLTCVPGAMQHSDASPYDASLPASFTPGRNLLFLTLAAIECARIGARDIVTGVCQTDYSGYPDCRLSTIKSLESTLNLGMGIKGGITIHTPLMHLTKAETWKLAHELDILDTIINETLTDYAGSHQMNEWGRGTLDNPASKLRAAGYFEAKKQGWIP